MKHTLKRTLDYRIIFLGETMPKFRAGLSKKYKKSSSKKKI